jgi:hypothetical protein
VTNSISTGQLLYHYGSTECLNKYKYKCSEYKPNWQPTPYTANDLQELKVKRWRQETIKRDEEASVIKEKKVVREPSCQGVIFHIRDDLHLFTL